MLIDQVKQRMFQAMKSGNVVEKEILRTAIGEVTRTGDEVTDERLVAVLRKLVNRTRKPSPRPPMQDSEPPWNRRSACSKGSCLAP